MGNCWGSQAQVNNNDSQNVINKPSSPESLSTNKFIKQASRLRNDGSTNSSHKLPLPTSGGGNKSDGGSSSGGVSGGIEIASYTNFNVGNNNEVPPTGEVTKTPNLKMFKFAVLRSATRNFRPDTMLGEGGFGRVFKGWIDENFAPSKVGIGIPVAVKKSNPDSEQGLQEWQAEVKFLGKFSHPNLVKLLGYCWEDRQFLLVYEYMQKGSLESHLFRRGAEPLSWEIRLKIAMGAARGLAFLHNSEKSVIYRDFKASNILLDGEFNAKLSDFGLAKLGPTNGNSHVTTRVVGTFGYAAPEYIATGHLYIKSDVYGFGVVLLELLTGLQALDPNRPSGSHNLVEWAKPSLCDKRKLKKIIDPRLENQYPSAAAVHLAQVSFNCLEGEPKNRPSMEEVLRVLERINLIKEKPKQTKAKGKGKSNVPSSSYHGRGISSQRGHENRRNSESQSHHYHQYGRS